MINQPSNIVFSGGKSACAIENLMQLKAAQPETALNFDSCIAKPQLTSPLKQTMAQQAPSLLSGSVISAYSSCTELCKIGYGLKTQNENKSRAQTERKRVYFLKNKANKYEYHRLGNI